MQFIASLMKLLCILIFVYFVTLAEIGNGQVIQSVIHNNQTYTFIAQQMSDYGMLTILDPTGLLVFCRMNLANGNINGGCLKFKNINDLQSLPEANNMYG